MTIVLLALTLAFLLLQPIPAAVAGSWVAERNGTVFVRLELRVTDGALSAGLATGDVQFDAKGEVKNASPVPARLTPITDLVATGSDVSFVRLEGNDTERFRLRVVSEDRAELQLLPDEEMLEELKELGIPAPKPIALRKIR
jgi:hypothetical protein